MKQLLDALEAEIHAYEVDTGKMTSQVSKMTSMASNFTGYTAQLIAAVLRVTHHLKEVQFYI